ncbi:MAG: response regulator, partial [Halospina sp.]
MATILWVEDQSHWIDRFKPVLEVTAFDDQPTRVQVFRFAEAACQHIKLADAGDAPDLALLDANMNGNEQAGFSVSRALLRKWPDLPIVYLSEYSGTGVEQEAIEEQNAQDFIAKHQRN